MRSDAFSIRRNRNTPKTIVRCLKAATAVKNYILGINCENASFSRGLLPIYSLVLRAVQANIQPQRKEAPDDH